MPSFSYHLQHRHRIEDFAFVLGGDVKMLAGAATSRASDAEDGARGDGGALGGEDSGEVAVADAEVAVADGDEVAGARVVTYFVYRAGEHGEDEVAVGGEVDAAVHRALACERVGAVAEG